MQQALQFSNKWGGWRERAGRKKRTSGTAHATRPALKRELPTHVTMKRLPGLNSFRRNGVYQLITAVFKAAQKDDFRIVHYSSLDLVKPLLRFFQSKARLVSSEFPTSVSWTSSNGA